MPTRFWQLLVLIPLFSVVVLPRAYAEDAPAQPEPAADIVDLLDRLMKATAAEDTAAVAKIVDHRAISKQACDAATAAGMKIEARRLMEPLLAVALRREPSFEAFERYRIYRIDQQATTRAVIVRLFQGDGASDWQRLTLRGTGEALKVTDYESLSLGLPMSRILELSLLATQADSKALRKALAGLQEAVRLVGEDSLDEALVELQDIEAGMLPDVFEGLRALLIATALIGEEAYDDAVGELQIASRLLPKTPVCDLLGGIAANGLGEYGVAVSAISRYHKRVGPDGDSLTHLGNALLGLDRSEDAVRIFQDALKDMPSATDALAGLARAMETPTAEALKPYLAALPSRAVDFFYAPEATLFEGDLEATEALAMAFIALEPKHSDGPFFLGRVAAERGKHDEAFAFFVEALRRQDQADEVSYYQDPLLDACLVSGKLAEGLDAAKDKLSAFRYFRETLNNEDDAPRLEVVARWGKEHLLDHEHEVAVAEGCAAFWQKRYADAVRVLSAHYAAIERAAGGPEPEDEASSLLWDMEDPLFRSQLRLDERTGAEMVARKVLARDDDPYYMAIIDAVEGRHERAAQRLTFATSDDGQWPLATLLTDADLTRFLKLAPYAKLVAAAEKARDG